MDGRESKRVGEKLWKKVEKYGVGGTMADDEAERTTKDYVACGQ